MTKNIKILIIGAALSTVLSVGMAHAQDRTEPDKKQAGNTAGDAMHDEMKGHGKIMEKRQKKPKRTKSKRMKDRDGMPTEMPFRQ